MIGVLWYKHDFVCVQWEFKLKKNQTLMFKSIYSCICISGKKNPVSDVLCKYPLVHYRGTFLSPFFFFAFLFGTILMYSNSNSGLIR